MKKIPTIFERDWSGDSSRVLNRLNPDCAWVFAGEGIATRKIDGTACLIRNGQLFKRRELKSTQTKPENFISESYGSETGKTVGWVPVGDGPDDKYHREAFSTGHYSDGTYELVGPNIQGNPEHLTRNQLVRHGTGIAGELLDVPRDFVGLRTWLDGKDIEGIVFHHEDGRMGKIKLRDFGLKRKEVKP